MDSILQSWRMSTIDGEYTSDKFRVSFESVCGLGFWIGLMALRSTSFPVIVPGLCRYRSNFYWILSNISHQQNLIPRTYRSQLTNTFWPVSENSPYIKPHWAGSQSCHLRMQQNPVSEILFSVWDTRWWTKTLYKKQ